VDQQFRVRAQFDSGPDGRQAQRLNGGAEFDFGGGGPWNRSSYLSSLCTLNHDRGPPGRAWVADGRSIGKDEKLFAHEDAP
jgi:hypothetical protein